MRYISTIFLALSMAIASIAQNLTGIWRGYFIQPGFDMTRGMFLEERYNYEVQINTLKNNAIEGVTYSYKTTVFYGKAEQQGVWNRKTKNLVFKETRMLDQKIDNGSAPCLMTCFMDYSKQGKKQILMGTYTSVNLNKVGECGTGRVYLEKVETSEFEKEPFLRTEKPKAQNPSPEKVTRKPSIPTKNDALKNEAALNAMRPKLKFRPGAEEFYQPKKPKTIPKNNADSLENALLEPDSAKEIVENKIEYPVPPILLKRKNPLANRVVVDSKEIKIEYYDNGQIDNDTITVYDNNRLVVNHGRLSYSPITINVSFDNGQTTHEIITVAENLGDIPPNTALMVVTSGENKYEVHITSDEMNNAKVILEYNPKGELGVHKN